MKKEYKSSIPEISLQFKDSGFKKTKITSSEDSFKYIRQFYESDINIYESFFLLLLNRANNTIGWVKISQGGMTGTVADPLIIAKYAIDFMAKGIILAHNHPSGVLKPSNNDNELTKKIVQGMKLFDVNVLDHIILGDKEWFSFADEGLL